jgi:hypothetical protein
VPPLYTPAPVYAGLSPVSSISEELQEPEDIHVDKWEAARNGFLYDNRNSPVGLNSVYSALEVNPVLAHETIPLIVDLSRGINEISTMEEPGQSWPVEDSEDILSQPATIPRVTKLRLLSPKTKYTIEVVSRTGVTVSTGFLMIFLCRELTVTFLIKVGHVLNCLIKCFHTNLDPITEGSISREDDRRRAAAYHANARYRAYGRALPYLRRVDLLYGEPIFDGLSADLEVTYERSGEKDCSILVMHFSARSENWRW